MWILLFIGGLVIVSLGVWGTVRELGKKESLFPGGADPGLYTE